MKTARDQMNKENKQGMSKKPRPEIRDNLDSRKNEEQDFKGDDISHKSKEKHKDLKKKSKS